MPRPDDTQPSAPTTGQIGAGSRMTTQIVTSGGEDRALGAVRRRARARRIMPAALIAMVVLAAVPSIASATFTRPFLREISSTPGGAFGPGPFGVALDSKEALWVSDGPSPPVKLDEFSAGENEFIEEIDVTGTGVPEAELTRLSSLAILHSTDEFFLTGDGTLSADDPSVEVFAANGGFLRRWKVHRPARIAIDNTGLPSTGSVYVADGEAIERFNAEGEPLNFEAKGPCVTENQLFGIPSGGGAACEPFHVNHMGGVTVGPSGEVFLAITQQNTGSIVIEYAGSGAFVQTFDGHESPGLDGSLEENGFGGPLGGVAVDPVSDHLLVSVIHLGKSVFEPLLGAIDEFDLESGKYLNQTIAAGGGSSLLEPGELTTSASGSLYVADPARHVIDVYGAGHFLPTVQLTERTEAEPTSITLTGRVNPEGLALTQCDFEYVTSNDFAKTGFAAALTKPCSPTAEAIPADSQFHSVTAAVGGLVSGESYKYRLTATTEGALGGEASTAAAGFTTPHAPVVTSTNVANLSSTFAELRAAIRPLGASTHYRFEFDTAPYSGSEEHGISVPVTPAAIGSGGGDGQAVELVSQPAAGLAPATTYHMRVVASNRIGVTDGAEVVFATAPQSLTGLPDGRAYELVTPADKLGGSDMFGRHPTNGEFENTDLGEPSQAGDGFLLHTHAAFGPFPGNEESAYVFTRRPDGWTNTSLAVPTLGVQNVTSDNLVVDEANFAAVAINDEVGSIASPEGTRRVNLVGPPGGPYTVMHEDPLTHEALHETNIVGGSGDLGELVLQGPSRELCPGAKSQKNGATLCESRSGVTSLLNVQTSGEPLDTCGAVLGSGTGLGGEHNAVSSGGRVTVFTAPDPRASGVGCWNPLAETNAPQLYARANGETIRVSAAPSEEGTFYAGYVGASKDGEAIFFMSNAWLTADHPTQHDPELYECRLKLTPSLECHLTRVSAGESGFPGAEEGAQVAAVPAVPDSGKAVYYMAFSALAAGSVQESAGAGGNAPVNLYRYDTESKLTTYVATVGRSEYPTQVLGCEVAGQGTKGSCDTEASWYTTPDGRYLLFASTRGLTGNEATGSCVLPGSGGARDHCDEVYRYDAEHAALACVSCNPTGAPAVSNALFARSAVAWDSSGPVRALSDDGTYAFFDTADPLVANDGNGTLDVYEWHEGHVALISSGRDSAPSFFLGTSPLSVGGDLVEAANVFIGTHARLVSEDTDTNGDVYDARICSAAAPCIKPAAGQTGQCEGDACHPTPPTPVDNTPASATFTGPEIAPGPTSGGPNPPAHKTLTNAQKRARALKACHRKAHMRRRRACEASVRRRFPIRHRIATRRNARSTTQGHR
jgi:hypothetical protein